MPGKTPYEAFSAFVTPLADALKCVVGHPRIEFSSGGSAVLDTKHNLYLTGRHPDTDDYLRLGNTELELRARMFYLIITDDRKDYGPYRVTTRGYDYSVRKTDGTKVLDYHWHPTGLSDETRPHIHLGSAQLAPDAVLSNKQHLLTGRVTFEAVIRNLISMGVPARFPDWSDVLDLCETPHLLHRTWTTDYKQEVGASVPEDG
jgi:hypothetical protein